MKIRGEKQTIIALLGGVWLATAMTTPSRESAIRVTPLLREKGKRYTQ